MYGLRDLNHKQFTGLILLLVLQFFSTRSEVPLECSTIWSTVHTVQLSPTSAAKLYGLEPLNTYFNTYDQPQCPCLFIQFVGHSATTVMQQQSGTIRGVHFNGHQGTLGIIALLFPFHGFT